MQILSTFFIPKITFGMGVELRHVCYSGWHLGVDIVDIWQVGSQYKCSPPDVLCVEGNPNLSTRDQLYGSQACDPSTHTTIISNYHYFAKYPNSSQRDVSSSCDDVRSLLVQLAREEIGGATEEQSRQKKEQIWAKLEVSYMDWVV